MSVKLHRSTNIGIEIEICMKKDFYESLQTTKQLFTQVYKFPEGEDPFRDIPKSISETNLVNSTPEVTTKKKTKKKKTNSKSGTNTESSKKTESSKNTESGTNTDSSSNGTPVNSLRDIVLTEDLTCKCPDKTYINAEINSPKMDKKDIKHFMKFLEEKLFVDRKQFYQGTTCGIHIHWSNHKLQKFKKIPEYNFEFIKVIFFLKKYISHKVIHKDFSGREHFYDKLNNEMRIVLAPESTDDKFSVLKSMTINLRGDMSLTDVKTLVENEPVEYFGWLEELDTDKKKILAFIDSLTPSEYSDLVFIHLLIVQKFEKPTVYNKHYGLPQETEDVGELNIEHMLEFFLKRREELVVDPKVRESVDTVMVLMIKNLGDPYKWKKSKICLNFRKLFTINLKKNILNSGYFSNKKHEENFFELLWFIDLFKNIILRRNRNLNVDKYRHFWERFMSITLRPMGKVDNNYIIERMVNHFYKRPICLYSLENFHMELRVFSLDDLFSRLGDNVTGKDITKELYRFLEMTNTMMMNILNRFNKFFKDKKGIPPESKQFYKEFFLMDKEYKPGNKLVKRKFNELFGIESPKKRSLLPSISMPKLSRSRRGGPGKIKKDKKGTKKKLNI